MTFSHGSRVTGVSNAYKPPTVIGLRETKPAPHALLDTIHEATDGGGRMYEEERVVRSLRATAGLCGKEVLARLLADVDGFVGGAEQSDDTTLILVQRTQRPSTP